jgi:transposase
MPRVLTNEVQNNLKSSLAKGTPFSVISNRLGISKGVISKYSKKWFPEAKKNKAGRHGIVSDSSKSLVRRKVIKGDLLTARDVHKELTNLGYRLTPKSATNLLKSMGFFSAIKKKSPI